MDDPSVFTDECHCLIKVVIGDWDYQIKGAGLVQVGGADRSIRS